MDRLAVPSAPQIPIPPRLALRNEAPPRSASRPSGRDLALAGIAHDARNLVTSLRLCVELIAEPGVLASGQHHFAGEMQGLVDAADAIVRRLSSVSRTAILASEATVEETPVRDLADAVRQLSSLLAAVAGPAVAVQLACLPCAGELRISEESLTRILLNLVRNAADAMPSGGRIRIAVQRSNGGSFLWTVPGAEEPAADGPCCEAPGGPQRGGSVLLTVEDDGPGIPRHLLERIFDPGFSTRRGARPWPDAQHHGLGLSIVRELVESAGGSVRAVAAATGGARFEVEFPLTNVMPAVPSVLAPSAESER